ncbi:MAG: VOC family protein [Ilumatobacteraceae bacterium]
MNDDTPTKSTLTNIGVTMFTVTDVDDATAWYCDKLGFEVCADVRFGENGENRWLEVAPPGSKGRLSLNPPMGNKPGGGSIGIDSSDVMAELGRLQALGVVIDMLPMDTPGAPMLFMLSDPDGNHIAVVETAPT